MDVINRRELLQMTAALAVAGIPKTTVAQEPNPGNTLRFFPGFKAARVKTSGAEINLVHAGSGPPLLLMHGAPQTHVSMRLIAPELAKDYTVIVPDLRGYGDSSKPADGENHANYSKRAMALDQVEVMKQLRLRQVRRRRPRSRRPRRPSHGARSCRQGDAAGRARHHPDLLPLHARHDRVHPGVLPLVQLRACRRRGRRTT